MRYTIIPKCAVKREGGSPAIWAVSFDGSKDWGTLRDFLEKVNEQQGADATAIIYGTFFAGLALWLFIKKLIKNRELKELSKLKS